MMFCWLPLFAIAQDKIITGTVVDAISNNSIAGVSVKTLAGNNAVQTNTDGSYRIKVPNNSTALIFSFIGYASQEIKIAGHTQINVRLVPTSDNLDEVLVVGYGTQIKKDLTGAVTSVKMSDLEDVPLATIESGLQGRAPGVFVNNSSGKLGQALQIRVRGISSISAGSQPLFVIDGVPIITDKMGTYLEADNPLAAINQNDIESMEVLSDAMASAIYGARASNGVVIITTKKGKAGKTKIDLGLYTGYSDPTKKGEFLNASQYRELLTASVTNAGLLGPDPVEQYPDMATFWSKLTGTNDWNENTNSNWVNEGLQQGSIYNANLSVSGGDEKTRFIASGGYNDTKGIIVSNRLKRTSGRLALDHNAMPWLEIGGSININKLDNYRITSDNAFANPMQLNALPPIQPIRLADGALNNRTIYYNNLIDIEDGKKVSNTYRTFGTAYATAKLTDYLSFKTEYGMDFQNMEEDYYLGARTQKGGETSGYALSYQARSINFNSNNVLSFQKTFNSIHQLSGLVGMAYQEGQLRTTAAEGKSFPSDKFMKITSAAIKSELTSSEAEKFAFLSYFVRANYKLMDKYLLEGSIRWDGSSRFGADNRYGSFPAAAIGWILSEEDFLKESPVLNFLKIRASYGLTGNANIRNFAAMTLYQGANYAGTAGTVGYQLGDPRLSWESTKSGNIGIDFTFFHSRLSGKVDVYRKKTSDLLLNMPIPSTTGYADIYKNIGDLENKGLEISLNSRNLIGEFRWSSSFNISWNKNKILRLVAGQPIYPGDRYLGRLEEGKPFSYFYGKAYAGVDPNTGDALYYLDASKTTSTSVYSEAADQYVGDPNPDFYGGFGNTFSYKNFDLDIQTQFVYGNDLYNVAGVYQSANGDYFDNQTVDQLSYWKNPGDITQIPRPHFGASNGTRPSSRYVQDGSYFRVKNVVLGYRLPEAMAKHLKMQNARLYVSATNLFTITNYEGYDPEINATFTEDFQLGTDFYTPPQARTITFGIQVGF